MKKLCPLNIFKDKLNALDAKYSKTLEKFASLDDFDEINNKLTGFNKRLFTINNSFTEITKEHKKSIIDLH